MIDLKAFRKANKLTQKDLAEYLGVHHSFIANIETGRSSLPNEQLDKILSNTNGWDINMLRNNVTSIMTRASGNSNASIQINSNNNNKPDANKMDLENAELRLKLASLQRDIESLTQQLAEEKRRSEQYWEMIQKLMK